MAKTYVGIAFVDDNDSNYRTDAGIEYSFSSGFYIPQSLSGQGQGFWVGIGEASGGIVTKVGKTVITNLKNMCPEGLNVSPRRLRFVLDNGQSFSVPVYRTNDINATAKSIYEAVNGIRTVVCIELIGEHIKDYSADFGLSPDASQTIASTGGSNYYSGKVEYELAGSADYGNPTKVYKSVKISAANKVLQGDIATIWANCVPEFKDLQCGGSQNFDHRRYILTYFIDANQGNTNEPIVEQREIPCVDASETPIKACGDDIVSTLGSSLACLSYKGESYRFVKRLI